MKNTLFILMLVVVFASCGGSKNGTVSGDLVNNSNSAEGKDPSKLPIMSFETMEHDFGEIMEGEKVSFSFKFKNTGKSDLLISNYSATCGCTVPDYPRTPIKPGDDGLVTVSFNSTGKHGVQHKTVTLSTNCEPNSTVLSIKAIVKQP